MAVRKAQSNAPLIAPPTVAQGPEFRPLTAIARQAVLLPLESIRAERFVRGLTKISCLRVRVSDEVVQAAAVCSESVELFHRDAALIFNYALQATINVPCAGNDTTAELVLCSDDPLIRVLHSSTRSERFATANRDARSPEMPHNTAAMQRLRVKVSGIRNEQVGIIRIAREHR